ncbi:MAG: hypothetical protein GXP49_16460 [Deltaproteobacteria bacterium]|nr:hypothetical protein [Deltaproteobacteria bacterium]
MRLKRTCGSIPCFRLAAGLALASGVLALLPVTALAEEKKSIEERLLEDMQDKQVKTWKEFLEKHSGTCIGKKELILQPEVHEIGNKKYRYSGYRIDVLSESLDKDHRAILGVMAATKNFLPETRENIKALAEKFKAAKVDAILVVGDLAYVGKEIEDILMFLADHAGDIPILVVIGNAESRGPYGRALRNAGKKKVNIINLNIVRLFNGDDFSLVSLPGYYDRRFVQGRGSCVYRKQQVRGLGEFVKEAKGPVVLVSHGPPRTNLGKKGIDATPDGKNVGDPEMTRIIKKLKIDFGTFSHILEAGGKGVSLARNRAVRPGRWSNDLFVNAGAVNALDWNMNGGWTSQGMGMIVTIDKDGRSHKGHVYKAKFELIKLKRKEIDYDDEDDY